MLFCVLLVILYGMESSTLTCFIVTEEAAAFEVGIYHRMLRIYWTKRIANEKVLNQMNIDREIKNCKMQKARIYLGRMLRNRKWR